MKPTVIDGLKPAQRQSRASAIIIAEARDVSPETIARAASPLLRAGDRSEHSIQRVTGSVRRSVLRLSALAGGRGIAHHAVFFKKIL